MGGFKFLTWSEWDGGVGWGGMGWEVRDKTDPSGQIRTKIENII